jgi:hypothetical protein
VYTPILPLKRTTMSHHRKLGIYVGFQSPFILKYLEPLTSDLFTTRFADCIFNEDHFSTLGEDNKFIDDGRKIVWDDKTILSSDPRTKETYLQVKILELHQITSNLSDVFTDYKGVIKSLNHVVNAPYRVDVLIKITPPLKKERAS